MGLLRAMFYARIRYILKRAPMGSPGQSNRPWVPVEVQIDGGRAPRLGSRIFILIIRPLTYCIARGNVF